jgi:hypothetical protein
MPIETFIIFNRALQIGCLKGKIGCKSNWLHPLIRLISGIPLAFCKFPFGQPIYASIVGQVASPRSWKDLKIPGSRLG